MILSALRKYLHDKRKIKIILWLFIALELLIIWLLIKLQNNEEPYELLIQISLLIFITIGIFIIQSLFIDLIHDRPEFSYYLKTVESELKILGMTLADLHKDSKNVELIKDKMLGKENFLAKHLIRREFQFLLLNPNAITFRLRGRDEKKDIFELKFESAKTIRHLEDIIDFLKKNDDEFEKSHFISFRFYESMPTHSMIITDNLITIGPYLLEMAGTKSKWIKITDYFAIIQYVGEFNKIWRNHSFTKSEISNDINNRELFLISSHLKSKQIEEYLKDHPKIRENEYNSLVSIAKELDRSNREKDN